MSVEEQDYKLEVLEYAINQCIDRLLPSSSEDALSVILYQCNEVVWRVATEVYTNSGYQIDFVFIRDILNLRVEPLHKKIAEEKRIKAELEAQRLAKIAEEKRIKVEQEAEKARIEKQRKEQELKIYESEIFRRVRNIIVELLEVEEKQIKLDSVLSQGLGADDSYEESWLGFYYCPEQESMIMAIEEEFDIEIPDEECDDLLSWNVGQLVNLVMQKID